MVIDKQAALEAYIRVIDEVKAVSGVPEDGDSLMNKAFGGDKQTPVIQFNSLQVRKQNAMSTRHHVSVQRDRSA